MPTAGIIGGGGFIGSYVTKQFLVNGYRVKVSATDIATQAKYADLRLRFRPLPETLAKYAGYPALRR